MKKNLVYFVVVVIAVVVAILINKQGFSGMTAGNGGFSLKEMNDTTTTSIVNFAEVNTNNEQNLAQVTSIANWEHQYGNGVFVGADIIATASTEFGIMCPTYVAKCGLDFNAFRLEGRVGNFTRNGVTTQGFGPQFSNFAIVSGEGASVSNAVQLAIISNGTKLYAGHQGGSKFYQLNDGNYYVGLQQSVKNITVNGGMDFAETTTGYAAVKWTCKNDVFTLTGNKLGSANQNYILSYVHNNIPVCKGVVMNLGSALYSQPTKTGLHVVAGLCKGNVKLFAQGGGYVIENTVKPTIGLGVNYKL